MYSPLIELEKEIEAVFKKLMYLSSPGTLAETVKELNDRKLACLEATARIMQGRLMGNRDA